MPFLETYTEQDSSLIQEIEYYEDTLELRIKFRKYYVDELVYLKVPADYFYEFTKAKSVGRFYNQMIKPNFHYKNQKMANKPKTKNQSSKDKRFIKISVCVKSSDPSKMLNPKLLVVAENGNVYLNATLHMLPDGEVDQYGNLGFITQDVPKNIYEKEKNAKEKTKGPILGNGTELDWEGNGTNTEDIRNAKSAPDNIGEDLPF